MHNIVALWSIPRSISTAFERMMIARDDCYVFHEPFSAYFYFSHERLSNRMEHVEPKSEFHYTHILDTILEKSQEQPVFFKDHAYHISHVADQPFLSHFTNTFIIRHPEKTLPSQYHYWHDMTTLEAGYAELYHVFQLAKLLHDKIPLVIDSDHLLENPHETVETYCKAVDIPFIPEALQWDETVSHPDWNRIDSGYWHTHLKQTKGFETNNIRDYLGITDVPYLCGLYKFCLPYYTAMKSMGACFEVS